MRIVLDTDFPDPDVSKIGDEYIALATNAIRDGEYKRLQAALSYDLDNWELQDEEVLIQIPDFSTDDEFLAPNLFIDDKKGEYLLYYPTRIKSNNGKILKGISVAKSLEPNRGFKDFNTQPIVWGEGWEFIDPFVYADKNGQKIMICGSTDKPLKKYLLNDAGDKILNSTPEEILNPIPNDFYERVIEGAYIDFLGDDLFLYYSGADCFGNGIDRFGEYAIMIAKYDTEKKKFIKRTEKIGTKNNVILEGNQRFKNPGNNSIVRDQDDRVWLFAHAIDRENQYYPSTKYNRRPMIKAEVQYINGWPEVLD